MKKLAVLLGALSFTFTVQADVDMDGTYSEPNHYYCSVGSKIQDCTVVEKATKGLVKTTVGFAGKDNIVLYEPNKGNPYITVLATKKSFPVKVTYRAQSSGDELTKDEANAFDEKCFKSKGAKNEFCWWGDYK